MIKVCKKKNKSGNKLLFEQVAVDVWDNKVQDNKDDKVLFFFFL